MSRDGPGGILPFKVFVTHFQTYSMMNKQKIHIPALQYRSQVDGKENIIDLAARLTIPPRTYVFG